MSNEKICDQCGDFLCGSKAINKQNQPLCHDCNQKEKINELFAANDINYKVPDNLKIIELSPSSVATDALTQLLYLGRFSIPMWGSKRFHIMKDNVSFTAKGKNGWYMVVIDYDFGADAYKLSFSDLSSSEKLQEIDNVYFDEVVSTINDFLYTKN